MERVKITLPEPLSIIGNRSAMNKYRLFLFGVISTAGGALAQMPDEDDLAAAVSYCFYLKAQQVQLLAAGGSDQIGALQELETVQNWQAKVDQFIPDRDERNRRMAQILPEANRQLADANGNPVKKAEIISRSMPECESLMARADLKGAADKAGSQQDSRPSMVVQAPELPEFRQRPASSPFKKDVFAPGWRGDIAWAAGEAGASRSYRVTLLSRDQLPHARNREQIHLGLRISGVGEGGPCLGEFIETGVSPDGQTLSVQTIDIPTCGKRYAVRLTALTTSKLRVEVDDAGVTVASGELMPVSYEARLPAVGVLKPAPVTATPGNTAGKSAPKTIATTKAFQSVEATSETGIASPQKRLGVSDVGKKSVAQADKSQATQRAVQQVDAVNKMEVRPLGNVREFLGQLQLYVTPQEVFEGDFSSAGSGNFKLYYTALQWAYSDNCKTYLPPDSVKRGYISQLVYGDGYRGATTERSALIPPRFLEKFDAYANEVSKIASQIHRNQVSSVETDLRRGRSIRSILSQGINNNPIVQMSTLVEAAGGCDSRALYQLRENFYLAAYGKPSLQARGANVIRLEEKDRMPANSLYSSCMAREHASQKFCRCFDREAQGILTPEEMASFRENFNHYYDAIREISFGSPAPPASDRGWELYDIRNRCN